MALCQNKTVWLRWAPNPETNIAGYRVLVGMTSGIYANGDYLTGNVTNFFVSNLMAGTRYYFAITARNTLGMESDLSNEASIVTWTNAVPHIYKLTLQKSTDLRNWQQVTNWVLSLTGSNVYFRTKVE